MELLSEIGRTEANLETRTKMAAPPSLSDDDAIDLLITKRSGPHTSTI